MLYLLEGGAAQQHNKHLIPEEERRAVMGNWENVMHWAMHHFNNLHLFHSLHRHLFPEAFQLDYTNRISFITTLKSDLLFGQHFPH